MPTYKTINKKISVSAKELGKLNKLLDSKLEIRLITIFKTGLNEVRDQLKDVYNTLGKNPDITQLRKYNRLAKIEAEFVNSINNIKKESGAAIRSYVKVTADVNYLYTADSITEASGLTSIFNPLFSPYTKLGYELYVMDNLWYDSLSNNSAGLLTGVKRDFETVLRANAKEEIISGAAQGKSYIELTNDIKKRFDIEVTRARRIAFTETHKAQNFGSNEAINAAKDAADKVGVKVVKVWRQNYAAKTPRPDHISADGLIANDEGLFLVGGEYLQAPGLGTLPENNIYCHCSVDMELIDNGVDIESIPVNHNGDNVRLNVISSINKKAEKLTG